MLADHRLQCRIARHAGDHVGDGGTDGLHQTGIGQRHVQCRGHCDAYCIPERLIGLQRLPGGLGCGGGIVSGHHCGDLAGHVADCCDHARLAEQNGDCGTADGAQTGTGRGVGQQADHRISQGRAQARRDRVVPQNGGDVAVNPFADRRLHVRICGQTGDQRADRAAQGLRQSGIGQHGAPGETLEKRIGIQGLKPGLQGRGLAPTASDHRQDELLGGGEDRRLGVGLAEQIGQRRIGDRHRLTGGHRGGRGGRPHGA